MTANMTLSQVLKSFLNAQKAECNKKHISPPRPPPKPKDLSREQKRKLAAENMVGKSNKFDFSHRPATGVKLGQSICDSFMKEIGKAQKDAKRQSAKMRKSSESSSTSNSNYTSRDIGIHIIDFKAPGKDLGDEGVKVMAPGMINAINSSEGESHICIEDINLQGNGLTVKSLAYLAPVIQASLHDLKTINLSNNNIRVVTVEEARDFETFLKSFRRCFKLRRLDLSGNKELGAKAMEVLARVYARERAINPLAWGGESSVLSLENLPDDDQEYAQKVADMGERASPSERKLADACILKRRHGIRSLPYFNLTDTGLDDTGALWLSFVLPMHYYPDQLIDGLNAAPATSQIDIYQQDHESLGLDWHNNEDTLGKDGLQLLCKAEAIRRHRLHDLEDFGDGVLPNNANQSPLVRLTQGILPTNRIHVQQSTRIVFDDKTIGEVNAGRSKIARSVLLTDGAHSVDLWHTAVNLITISRRLLVLTRPIVPAIRRRIPKAKEPIQNTNLVHDRERLGPKDKENTSSKLIVPHWQEKSVHERRKEQGVEIPRVPQYATIFQTRRGCSASRQQYIQWQLQYMQKKQEKETKLPWVLPFEIFDRIALHLMSKEGLAAATEKQRRRAYLFGQGRKTLALERQWRKWNASSQLMYLLDEIKCLHYEEE